MQDSSSTTVPSEKASIISSFHRENFFKTLREEILQIEHIPFENSLIFEQSTMYNKMVDHLEQKAAETSTNSPKHQDPSIMLKQQIYFEGQSELLSQAEHVQNILEDLQDLDSKPIKFDYQGLERGSCRHCSLQKCPYYQSLNSPIGLFNESSLFSCLHCNCPLNSHKSLMPKGYFSLPISHYLQTKAFGDNHLSFNSLIAIFLCDKDPKRFEIELFSLFEYLKYGGFTLLAYKEQDLNEILLKMLQKRLLGMSHELDKSQYETLGLLFENPEELKKAFHNKKANKNDKNYENNDKNYENNNKNYDKPKVKTTRKNLKETSIKNSGFSSSQFDAILSKIHSKFSEKATKFAIIASFSHKSLKDFSIFSSFLQSNQAPKSFDLFYYSKNCKKAFLDSQIFFPEFFKLNFISFLLSPPLIPLEKIVNFQENSKRRLAIQQDKFKDLLQYNGFIQFNGDKETVSSEDFLLKAPQALNKFMKNAGFLINSLNNPDGILMNFCGKFGAVSLFELSCENSPNFHKFTDDFHNNCLYKTFCPVLSNYQRVLVILRPNVLLSDLDELIINLYRINQFTVIKREIIKLTQNQAYYLARIEKIQEVAMENYLNFMRNGPVEIILMSHFGALEISKAIANGTEAKVFSKNPFLKEKEFIIPHDSSGFRTKEILVKKYDDFYESVRSMNPFNGVKSLLDPTKLIFDEPEASQDRLLLDLNAKTLYFKENSLQKAPNYNAEFRKNQLFKEMSHESFNFFVFSSENEVITEELTSLFLSECSFLSMIQVLIKPNSSFFTKEIIKTLTEMGFQITYRTKIHLNVSQAENLLFHLGENDEFSDEKSEKSEKFEKSEENTNELVNFWCSEAIEVVSLIKMACKKEVLSLLRNFSLKKAVIPDKLPQPLSKSLLSRFLVPCWTESSFFFTLSLINPILRDFSHETLIETLNNPSNISNILEYILMNCVGDTLNEKKAIEKLIFEDSINEETNNHHNFCVSGKRLGDFEIRIRKISSEANPEEFVKIEIEYRLLAWYYSEINRKLHQRSPISYHYKVLSDISSKKNENYHKNPIFPTSSSIQIFDCQQYVGIDFLSEILNQMHAHANHKSLKSQSGSSSPMLRFSSITRGNIVAYLWGSKLAKFVKTLETVESRIKGFGEIKLIKGELKGEFSKEKRLSEEKLKFEGILKNLTEILDELYEIETVSHMRRPEEKTRISQGIAEKSNKLAKNLDIILKSESYRYLRKDENLRVLPQELELENLRIFCNRAQILEILLHGEFETLNFYYEINEAKNTEENTDKDYRGNLRENPDKNYRENPDKNYRSNLKENPDKTSKLNNYESSQRTFENSQKNFSLKPSKTLFDSSKLHYNDYSLINVKPEIKSKYGFVAMVFYLLENDKSLLERFNYEKKETLEALIKGIKEGFIKTYWLDSNDLEFLQLLHKETVVEESFVKRKVPDLIKLEVFFYALEEINRNVIFLKKLKGNIEENHVKKQKKLYEINRKLLTAENDQIKQFHLLRKNYEKEHEILMEKLMKNLSSHKEKIRQYFENLANFSIFYNFEEVFLMEESQMSINSMRNSKNEINSKVKIAREKYFKPFLMEKWELNLDEERYQKDLNEMYNYKDDVYEKYGGAVFYYNIANDKLQQNWIEKRPLFVRNLREVHREEKEGVLVEKIVPNAEKMLRNALEKEAKKFKDFKKAIKGENEVEKQ